MAQKIQPMGLAGRRATITAPGVANSTGSATSNSRPLNGVCDRFNHSSHQVAPASTSDSPHIPQAKRAAVRRFIRSTSDPPAAATLGPAQGPTLITTAALPAAQDPCPCRRSVRCIAISGASAALEETIGGPMSRRQGTSVPSPQDHDEGGHQPIQQCRKPPASPLPWNRRHPERGPETSFPPWARYGVIPRHDNSQRPARPGRALGDRPAVATAPTPPPVGRPDADHPDRNCFAAIIYMARTSTPWRLLPAKELDCGLLPAALFGDCSA